MRRLAIGLIKLYQRTFSRIMPPTCRFEPSCSTYAIEAIEVHGLIKGGWMGVRRICRCHPFSDGGCDPVPRDDAPIDSDDERRSQNEDRDVGR